MAVTISTRGSSFGRVTHIYEFFDARVLGHLWFMAVSDGESVQMMVPTFRTEKAARIFERCVIEHPSGFLLSMDGQLELGRRIESGLAEGSFSGAEIPMDQLWQGLAFEKEQ